MLLLLAFLGIYKRRKATNMRNETKEEYHLEDGGSKRKESPGMPG